MKRKIQQSMSRADDPYDNAFMESYFSRFKAELLQDGTFENLEDARTEILEYIECITTPNENIQAPTTKVQCNMKTTTFIL